MMNFKKALKKLGDIYRKVIKCRGDDDEKELEEALHKAHYKNHPIVQMGQQFPPTFVTFLGVGGRSPIKARGWSKETPRELTWWTKGHALLHPMTFLVKYAPKTWRKSDLNVFNLTAMTMEIDNCVHPDLITIFDMIYNNNTTCLFFRVNGVIPSSSDSEEERTNMDDVSKLKQWSLFVKVIQRVMKEWLPAHLMTVTAMANEYKKDEMQNKFANLRGSLWYCTGMYNHLAEYIKLIKENEDATGVWTHPCTDMDPRVRHKILVAVAKCVAEDYLMKARSACNAAQILQETLPIGIESWHVGGEVYFDYPEGEEERPLLESSDSEENSGIDSEESEWWTDMCETYDSKDPTAVEKADVEESEKGAAEKSEKGDAEKSLEFEVAIKGASAESTLQDLRKVLPEACSIREKRRLTKAEYRYLAEENRAARLKTKTSRPGYLPRNQRLLGYPKDYFLHITETSEPTEQQENNLDTPLYRQRFRVNLSSLFCARDKEFSLIVKTVHDSSEED